MAHIQSGLAASDSNESTALLLQRLRDRDPSAMGALVSLYYDRVFSVCMSILRHRQDAEDATQETFSRFAKYFDKWDTRRPLEPWLITIAGNRCRTQLARKRPFVSLTPAEEPSSSPVVQDQATEALREEVSLVLERLPPRQRQAFEMFHENGLTYSQIAEQLGSPVGTIKTWVHRARTTLIDQLSKRDVVHLPIHRDQQSDGEATGEAVGEMVSGEMTSDATRRSAS